MTQISQTEDKEKETTLKWLFAEQLLRNPTNHFLAAMNVTFGDRVAALVILDNWNDTVEINRMKQTLVQEQGEEAFLPSKTSMVWSILHRAERSYDDSDYCKLMSLAADMQGMTPKANNAQVVVNNTTTNNKIMHIPVMVNNNGQHLSDDEWEQSLIQQQKTLTNGT